MVNKLNSIRKKYWSKRVTNAKYDILKWQQNGYDFQKIKKNCYSILK